MRLLGRLLVYAVFLVVALGGVVTGIVYLESRKALDATGQYVALGSSYAAGPQLGAFAPGSPHACWRTVDNYPHQLAATLGLRLVDVTCGGAKATNLLGGGPFFQRPQIEALGPSARLVTITVGGNDVAYIGDLGLLAWRDRGGVLGALARTFWQGPRPLDQRPFDELTTHLVQLVDAVKQRSPNAVVVFATYPRVLPDHGTCTALGIGESDAALMRTVARRLLAATEAAATRAGARIVEMDAASQGHDACSAAPWVNGASPVGDGAMFHPNRAGARAVAAQIAAAVPELKDL